ncbi:cell wall-binding protein [Bacillus sp. JJ1127]
MGILFSASPLASPLTENKVKADVDTFGTIVTTFGKIYDAFLAEPFGQWLEEIDVKNSYAARLENVAYKAPTFQKGEFGISAFDYYKNKDFSKKVKIAYANGKVEYKTIKHGEQIRIRDAGTIVDLTPDEPELSKHDVLYISQKQLDEGNTGVSLTNFKTYYLKSDNSGGKNVLADRFERKEFPGYFLSSGVRDIRYEYEDLFSKLPEEKRKLATITSQPVDKEVLSNYVTNDPKALADFKAREGNLFADTKLSLDTPIALPFITLNGGENYKIIPYKKGSNKVFVKKGSQYLSGKEGNNLQYSDSIGDNELFELVQIENSGQGEFQFRLNNKNGVSLAGNQYISQFGTDWSFKSEIRFTGKTNSEIHNWLREWYPGKENEKQKYDGIQIVVDEKDSTKWTAKDSSGNVIKNSWVNLGSDHYYAGSDGFLLKGWQEFNGKKYYFNPESFLLTTTNGTEIDGKYYQFNNDGSVKQSTWTEDHHGLHYSDASGAVIEKGLQEIDGKIYYFQNYNANKKEIRLEDQNVILQFSDKGVLEKASKLNGESLDDVVVAIFEGKGLFFEKGGSPRKIGVSKIDAPHPTLIYYSLEEGGYYSGWKETDGKKYYFQNGAFSTFDTHENIDGKTYYFNHEGQALLTGFVDMNGKTFYFNNKGEMVTGFYEINGKLYYFETSSDSAHERGQIAKNGIFNREGNSYAFSPDGVLYQNFKGYINNHSFGQRYIETNNEGIVTNI